MKFYGDLSQLTPPKAQVPAGELPTTIHIPAVSVTITTPPPGTVSRPSGGQVTEPRRPSTR